MPHLFFELLLSYSDMRAKSATPGFEDDFLLIKGVCTLLQVDDIEHFDDWLSYLARLILEPAYLASWD